MTFAESREDLEDCYGLDADRLFRYLPGSHEKITVAEHLTLWWLGVVETYLAAIGRGFPITAVRFEDLTRRPDAVLAKVFEVCGLGQVDTGRVRPVFGGMRRQEPC
jgi:hypothetical protein